jgi:hypothetical protein
MINAPAQASATTMNLRMASFIVCSDVFRTINECDKQLGRPMAGSYR